MISPKSFVLAGLLVAGAGILAFGPRPDADVPRDRVIVDYWEKWTGNEEAQMRKIVDDFNNSVGRQKGIYVRYVSTSQIAQKTLVSIAAGVPPDIAGLWDPQLVQYAALDALTPLESMAADRGITAATYKPVYWKACNYNGHLIGLVSTPAAAALHYNKRIFKENAEKLRGAGLDPDRPPATIDELDRYAKALDIVEPSGRIVRTGYLPMEPGWFLPYTCFWFGGDLWDPVAQKFTLTDPKTVKAYEWVRSYSVRLGKDAATDFRSGFGNFSSPQNPFLTGTVVMVQQGPWMANYINKLNPAMNEDWAAAPFPSTERGKLVTYCGFDSLVIPRGAKHPKEAFEFIAYVQRQEVSERLNKLHCKNSPLAKVSDDFLTNHPNPYIKVFEDLANSPDARGIPQVPIWPVVGDELTQVAQKLTLELADPLATLQATQDKLQAKYETYLEKQRARLP